MVATDLRPYHIVEWVDANRRLGRATDPSFRKHILLSHDRVTLNEAFYRAIVESRAHDVSHFVYQRVLRGAIDNEREIRERTVSDLRKALGSEALRELGIAPKNVFEFGREAAKQMLATIAAAGA